MTKSRLEALLKPSGKFGNYSWQIDTWSQLKNGAMVLRNAIFAEEQLIPEAQLVDEHDISAVHILLTSEEGLPIGTARLVKMDKGLSQIGKMGVLLEYRGEGVARFMLTELLRFSRRRHDVTVQLHAQSHAAGFYRKMGFKIVGQPFMEVNISHVLMETEVAGNEFAKSSINV